MNLQFQPDMPDRANTQWTPEGVVFDIIAKPIRFGPFPSQADADEVFARLVAATQEPELSHCDPGYYQEQPQKTTMCMESDQTPGNEEPSDARMCMDGAKEANVPRGTIIEVGSRWRYLGNHAPDIVVEVNDCQIITESVSTLSEHCWLRDEFLRVHAPV